MVFRYYSKQICGNLWINILYSHFLPQLEWSEAELSPHLYYTMSCHALHVLNLSRWGSHEPSPPTLLVLFTRNFTVFRRQKFAIGKINITPPVWVHNWWIHVVWWCWMIILGIIFVNSRQLIFYGLYELFKGLILFKISLNPQNSVEVQFNKFMFISNKIKSFLYVSWTSFDTIDTFPYFFFKKMGEKTVRL